MSTIPDSHSSSLDENLARLFARRRFGRRRDLEGIEALLSKMGIAAEGLLAVQIGGTNGKGSTAAFLESILHEAGLRTGLFTSPHLLHFRERFRISKELVCEQRLASVLAQVLEIADQCVPPSLFFEIATAIAVKLFVEEQVDVAIFEVGLGGRLDPTSVVPAALTVITSIGLDHMEVLGDKIEEIARQKAGLLRVGVPVVLGVEQATARAVLEEVGSGLPVGAQLLWGRDFGMETTQPLQTEGDSPSMTFSSGGRVIEGIFSGLSGAFQRKNLAMAIQAAFRLGDVGAAISDEAVREGAHKVDWPGRLQEVMWRGHRIWVDGGHNREACEILCEEFLGRKQSLRVIFGCAKDKEARAMLEAIAPIALEIQCCAFEGGRSMPTAGLERICRLAGLELPVSQAASVGEALCRWDAEASSGEEILILGSLFLVGEALAFFAAEKQGNSAT